MVFSAPRSWIFSIFGPSGLVAFLSAATRIGIRIVRCQRPAKRQKHNPCKTQALHSPTSPCSQSVRIGLERAISRCDPCANGTLWFVCPKSTTETDIVAKLLWCGIASEALRRNMPLRPWNSRARKPWIANRELRGWRTRALLRGVSRAAWKRRVNLEFEAKNQRHTEQAKANLDPLPRKISGVWGLHWCKRDIGLWCVCCEW